MKKIILLITIVSPFANADMDNICSVGSQRNADGVSAKIIELNCERNNILVWVDGRDLNKCRRKELLLDFVDSIELYIQLIWAELVSFTANLEETSMANQ